VECVPSVSAADREDLFYKSRGALRYEPLVGLLGLLKLTAVAVLASRHHRQLLPDDAQSP